ncbi:MAG: hypothetical protein NTV22_03390, partial [bacterium]|nr:hypothetical protein [bacterium]
MPDIDTGHIASPPVSRPQCFFTYAAAIITYSFRDCKGRRRMDWHMLKFEPGGVLNNEKAMWGWP